MSGIIIKINHKILLGLTISYPLTLNLIGASGRENYVNVDEKIYKPV